MANRNTQSQSGRNQGRRVMDPRDVNTLSGPLAQGSFVSGCYGGNKGRRGQPQVSLAEQVRRLSGISPPSLITLFQPSTMLT